MTRLKLRPELDNFSQLMEKILIADDYKNGREHLGIDDLISLVKEEFEELMDVLKILNKFDTNELTEKILLGDLSDIEIDGDNQPNIVKVIEDRIRKFITKESCDVTNICMMIHDNYGYNYEIKDDEKSDDEIRPVS